jgi:transcriptional regulator with XRE-family HTH domain
VNYADRLPKIASMTSVHGRKPKLRRRLLNFGNLIRRAREARVSSQQQAVPLLAKAGLKVSQSWVAQLETGRITEPSPEILRQIEQAYGIDYDRLVYTFIRDKFRLSDPVFVSAVSIALERGRTAPEAGGADWRCFGDGSPSGSGKGPSS